MTVIQFPNRRAAVQRAVAQGNTERPGWVFEAVEAEDGAFSIAAEHRSGYTISIHPGPNGWACLSPEGQVVGLYGSPGEAVSQIAI